MRWVKTAIGAVIAILVIPTIVNVVNIVINEESEEVEFTVFIETGLTEDPTDEGSYILDNPNFYNEVYEMFKIENEGMEDIDIGSTIDLDYSMINTIHYNQSTNSYYIYTRPTGFWDAYFYEDDPYYGITNEGESRFYFPNARTTPTTASIWGSNFSLYNDNTITIWGNTTYPLRDYISIEYTTIRTVVSSPLDITTRILLSIIPILFASGALIYIYKRQELL